MDKDRELAQRPVDVPVAPEVEARLQLARALADPTVIAAVAGCVKTMAYGALTAGAGSAFPLAGGAVINAVRPAVGLLRALASVNDGRVLDVIVPLGAIPGTEFAVSVRFTQSEPGLAEPAVGDTPDTRDAWHESLPDVQRLPVGASGADGAMVVKAYQRIREETGQDGVDAIRQYAILRLGDGDQVDPVGDRTEPGRQERLVPRVVFQVEPGTAGGRLVIESVDHPVWVELLRHPRTAEAPRPLGPLPDRTAGASRPDRAWPDLVAELVAPGRPAELIVRTAIAAWGAIPVVTRARDSFGREAAQVLDQHGAYATGYLAGKVADHDRSEVPRALLELVWWSVTDGSAQAHECRGHVAHLLGNERLLRQIVADARPTRPPRPLVGLIGGGADAEAVDGDQLHEQALEELEQLAAYSHRLAAALAALLADLRDS